jgi:hypothetical protein
MSGFRPRLLSDESERSTPPLTVILGMFWRTITDSSRTHTGHSTCVRRGAYTSPARKGSPYAVDSHNPSRTIHIMGNDSSRSLGRPVAECCRMEGIPFFFSQQRSLHGIRCRRGPQRAYFRRDSLSIGMVGLLGTVFQAALRGSGADNAISANSRASD